MMDQAAYRQLEVLNDVLAERGRQDAKWGEQNHDNGADEDYYFLPLQRAREEYESHCSWASILLEEVFEALCEEHSMSRLRAELIQVAAVTIAWLEAIDRSASTQTFDPPKTH